jgi:transcriptional regulator with XRE-family HTH domain
VEENWYAEPGATLGDRITAAREQSGLGPDALAGRLGVRADTVAAWEADQAEPRANRMQMLAGALGVSLVWLLTGQGDGPAPPPDPDAARADLETLLGEMQLLRGEAQSLASRLIRAEGRLRQIAADIR